MATTLSIRSHPYYLINSTTVLTIGSDVTVSIDGVQTLCTVIKQHVGTRNYVVLKK